MEGGMRRRRGVKMENVTWRQQKVEKEEEGREEKVVNGENLGKAYEK